MAETALTTATDRPSYETADGRFDEDRVRAFVEDYDGPEDPDYPGCVPIPMTREQFDNYEGGVEYWSAERCTALICRDGSPAHEVPGGRLPGLLTRVEMERGSPILCCGALRMVTVDAHDLRPRPRRLSDKCRERGPAHLGGARDSRGPERGARIGVYHRVPGADRSDSRRPRGHGADGRRTDRRLYAPLARRWPYGGIRARLGPSTRLRSDPNVAAARHPASGELRPAPRCDDDLAGRAAPCGATEWDRGRLLGATWRRVAATVEER